MKLFEKTGKMALGTRLRLLTAKVTEDAARIYELYSVEFSPKWFPVLFVLGEDGEKTITEIAGEIGHSQPSVSKIAQEMIQAGLVHEKRESPDKRRNLVALSSKGIVISKRIKLICSDIDIVIEEVNSKAKHNLWEAIAEWELLLDQQSLLRRVEEQKILREGKNVKNVKQDID